MDTKVRNELRITGDGFSAVVGSLSMRSSRERSRFCGVKVTNRVLGVAAEFQFEAIRHVN